MEKLFYHGKGGGGHQILGLKGPSEGQEEKVGGVSDLIKACPLSLVPCCRPYSKSWSSSAQVLFQGVDGSGGKTCENPYTRSTPVRVWSISSIGLGRLSLQKNISMRLVNQSAHLGSRCQRMHCTHGLNRTGYLIRVKFCWADN